MLYVYAQVRSDEPSESGGWLDVASAHALWVELGGKPDTPPVRLSWEKGKVRQALSRQGVGNLDQLFEKRRESNRVYTRLCIKPEDVCLREG